MATLRGLLIALLTQGWLLSFVACDATPLIKNNQNTNVQENEINHPYEQFHIQTDEGSNRFFKYQTQGGQFRKETRLDDGSVVGSYGWIDEQGLLRLWDYVADDKGYRILKTRILRVNDEEEPYATDSDSDESLSPPSPTSSPRSEPRALFDGGPLTSTVMFDSSSFSGRETSSTASRPITQASARLDGDDDDNMPKAHEVIKADNHPSRQRDQDWVEPKTTPAARRSQMHSRLHRRIDRGNGGVTHIQVQPLFPQEENEISSPVAEDIAETFRRGGRPKGGGGVLRKVLVNQDFKTASQPGRRQRLFKKIEPRGEGTRLRYSPSRSDRTFRRRNQSGPNDAIISDDASNLDRGKQFVVVKRRRRPKNPEKLSPLDENLSVNYETENTFHLEQSLPSEAGEDRRRGEYGYIDPFGIRRVVVYSSGPRGGIVKIKENDFVGPDTYFESS